MLTARTGLGTSIFSRLGLYLPDPWKTHLPHSMTASRLQAETMAFSGLEMALGSRNPVLLSYFVRLLMLG